MQQTSRGQAVKASAQIYTVQSQSMAYAPLVGGTSQVGTGFNSFSDDDQVRLREELLRFGCKVTEVRDRCYFKSVYFREPGGVLFEVATIRPGFLADESVATLGQALKLPPWEEANRADIEAALVPIHPAHSRCCHSFGSR